MGAPQMKHLRDLLVDFYSEHNPEKLARGLDINGIVMWTGRNGIDALNEVLRNETGHELDLNKNLGNAKKKAMRISTIYNPNQQRQELTQEEERVLLSKLHFFYMRNDPQKLVNIHKLHRFAMINGVDKLNQRLMSKYGKELPAELPDMQNKAAAAMDNSSGIVVKNVTSMTPEMLAMLKQQQNPNAQVPKLPKKGSPGKKKRRGKKKKGGMAIGEPRVSMAPGKMPPNGMMAGRMPMPSTVTTFPNAGPAPMAPPKVDNTRRKAPPLPQKRLPPLPNTPKPGRLPPNPNPANIYNDADSDLTDDDYDPQQAQQDLTLYFQYHDPEVIDAIKEYLDLYYAQGRDQLNMCLGNIYGMNLDEFLENRPDQAPAQPQFGDNHFSFVGQGMGDEGGFDPNANQYTMGVVQRQPQFQNEMAPGSEYSNDDQSFWNEPPEVAPKPKRILPPLPSKTKRGTKTKKAGKVNSQFSETELTFEEAENGSRKKRGLGGLMKSFRVKSMRVPAMKNPLGGMFSSFKNKAGNRFSLSPNANRADVRSPLEATPEEGPCDNYRLDMIGGTIGVCVCGFPRSDHSFEAKFGRPKKNAWKNMSARVNPSNNNHGDQRQMFNRFEKPAQPQAQFQQPRNQQNRGFSPQPPNNQGFEEMRTSQFDEKPKKKPSNPFKFTPAASSFDSPYDKTRRNVENKGQDARSLYMNANYNRNAEVVNSPGKRNQPERQQAAGGPCDNFRLDINGKFHGDCVCGYSKWQHKASAFKFDSDRQNAEYKERIRKLRGNLGDKEAVATLERKKATNHKPFRLNASGKNAAGFGFQPAGEKRQPNKSSFDSQNSNFGFQKSNSRPRKATEDKADGSTLSRVELARKKFGGSSVPSSPNVLKFKTPGTQSPKAAWKNPRKAKQNSKGSDEGAPKQLSRVEAMKRRYGA